jgi:lysophospholipase L1-like esterase
MFVGASVTEGYYASDVDHAYPADTVDELRGRGVDVDPIVVGRAGSGTAEVLTWRLEGKPDAIILQIATNDFGRNLSLARYRANYWAILQGLRALGPNARLLCLSGWRDPKQVNESGVTGGQFNEVTDQACRAFRGHFVNLGPLYLDSKNHGPKGHETDYGAADYFHPNDRGHAAIAKLVVTNLGPLPSG